MNVRELRQRVESYPEESIRSWLRWMLSEELSQPDEMEVRKILPWWRQDVFRIYVERRQLLPHLA
jgi:hypothetical protein